MIWLIHICDMTHSYTRHDLVSVLCRATFLFFIYTQHDAFIHLTRRIHTRDMTHSYTWHDTFVYVTWLIHIRDMTQTYAWHDSFIRVKRRIHTRDMPHSYTWHYSSIYPVVIFGFLDTRVSFFEVLGTHVDFICAFFFQFRRTRLVWHCAYIIEWLRLVGSLKSWVSFAKEPYKRTLFCKRDLYFQGAYES